MRGKYDCIHSRQGVQYKNNDLIGDRYKEDTEQSSFLRVSALTGGRRWKF